MKILLVTPHSDWSLEAIKSLPSFVKVEICQTGKQAHSKINEAPYDVIVVHLETSDTSGAELIRFISSRQIDQNVLIIEGEKDFRKILQKKSSHRPRSRFQGELL